ncbi:hypothetical protein IRJ41_016493 [Triplophysa rosa]|uniref:Uncharacterized protein n=1 Tax=Triplophysa rosa TaxID=992332 RepID=A0A9W8C6M3_TRIRA|nr:hypothetical protein IRJ41_016493 [Triplophysa rosa]
MNDTPAAKDVQQPPKNRKPTTRWWSKEEEDLRKCANNIWTEGMKKKELAARLKVNLPGRTEEKRLLVIDWTPPVENPPRTSEPPTSPPPPQASKQSQPTNQTTMDSYAEWKARMEKAIINNLNTLGVADSLRDTTLRIKEGKISVEEAAGEVEAQISRLFSGKWIWKEREERKEVNPTNARQLRRRQYSYTQKLYNINRKDAAVAVLNGSWREAKTGPAGMDPGLHEYWSTIIWKGGPPARIRGEPRIIEHWEILNPIGELELKEALKSLVKSAVGVDKVYTEYVVELRGKPRKLTN